MATYTIVNGTDAQLANVNGGGTDVEAWAYKDGVTLTDGELAALLLNKPGVAVFSDLTGVAAAVQAKRSAAIAAMYLSA